MQKTKIRKHSVLQINHANFLTKQQKIQSVDSFVFTFFLFGNHKIKHNGDKTFICSTLQARS